MKKTWISFGLVTLGFLMATSVASATTCLSDTDNNTASVDVTTIGSCTVTLNGNTYTFSNFSVEETAGTGTATIDLTNVTTSGDEIFLTFNPNEAAGGVTDEHFAYEINGVGMNGADLSIGEAQTGTAITEENCGGLPTFSDGSNCTPNLFGGTNNLGVNQSDNILSSSLNYTSSVSTVYVWKDLEVFGSLGHDSAFTESLSATPEPMTLSFVGLGLVGIGFLGRRKARR